MSAERLADPVPRSLDPGEEDTLKMTDPEILYVPNKDVQSATYDRSMKDGIKEG